MFLEFKINKNEYKLKCANIKLLICKRLSFQKADFLQFVKKQFFLYLFTLLFAWLELSFELN